MTTPPKPVELYQTFYGPGIFEPLARAFVPFAAPRPGSRVLDLACGTGIVARAVAREVGEDGSVVAVDLNPAMIAMASSLPRPAGAPIEWRVGDAVELSGIDGDFELVVCQQGLQFFPDREAALDRVRMVLAPGGRVAIAVWQDIARQTMTAELAEIEARHLEPLGVTYDDVVAPYALGDEAEVERLLRGAGFRDVEVVPKDFEAALGPPETFIRTVETAYGAVVPALVERPEAFEAFVAAVERDAGDVVARYTRDGEVRFPMPVIFARATAA